MVHHGSERGFIKPIHSPLLLDQSLQKIPFEREPMNVKPINHIKISKHIPPNSIQTADSYMHKQLSSEIPSTSSPSSTRIDFQKFLKKHFPLAVHPH